MKKTVIFGTVLFLYAAVNAQTTSTTPGTPATPVPVATNSTTSSQTAPANPKKFSGNLVIGASASVKDVRENGSSAMIDSANTLSLMYTATEKIKVGIGHNFGLRAITDSKQLADFNSDNGEKSAYKTMDPTINFNYKMSPLLGSGPYAIMSRYYLPVTQESQAKKSNGVLRTQAYITWSLNPKVDLSFFGQARMYLNSTNNSNAAQGSDSVMRTIVGPIAGYNFNDMYNVYYNPYFDFSSTGYQRGKLDADTANTLNHEIGLWITLASGSFIVNPSWGTSSDKLGALAYEGAGSDVNSEYGLTLIGNF